MKRNGAEANFDFQERSGEFPPANINESTSVAKISNELIYAKFSMSSTAIKVFDALMAAFDDSPLFEDEGLCDPATGVLRKDITCDEILTTFISTHSRSVKLKASTLLNTVAKNGRGSKTLSNAKAAADALFKAEVTIRNRWAEEGGFQGETDMRILSASAVGKYKGDDTTYIIATFTPEFIPYIIGVKNYTSLNLKYHSALSSQYSLRWHRLFKHLLDKAELGKVNVEQINDQGHLEYYQSIESVREMFNLHLPQSREKVVGGKKVVVKSVPYMRKKKVVQKKTESNEEFELRKAEAEEVLDLQNFALHVFERPLKELDVTDINVEHRLITKKENELRKKLHNEGKNPSFAATFGFKPSRSNPVVGVLFTAYKKNTDNSEFIKLSTELAQIQAALKNIPPIGDEKARMTIVNSYVARIDKIKADLKQIELTK